MLLLLHWCKSQSSQGFLRGHLKWLATGTMISHTRRLQWRLFALILCQFLPLHLLTLRQQHLGYMLLLWVWFPFCCLYSYYQAHFLWYFQWQCSHSSKAFTWFWEDIAVTCNLTHSHHITEHLAPYSPFIYVPEQPLYYYFLCKVQLSVILGSPHWFLSHDNQKYHHQLHLLSRLLLGQ